MIHPTCELESSLLDQGARYVVGFDEVGRGALAGPVMVGAVAVCAQTDGEHVLADDSLNNRNQSSDNPEFLNRLADSKLLSPRQRDELCGPVQKWAKAWAVGSATNDEIDAWGISHALGIAALRALYSIEKDLEIDDSKSVKNLRDSHEKEKICGILDGPYDYISAAISSFDAPNIDIPIHITPRVKADRDCMCVAAASVIAKVTRDQLMVDMSNQEKYSHYHWESNKGYGSKVHRTAIAKYGPSDLHRISWHLG